MTHPTNLELEQFFAGESTSSTLANHIAECDRCRTRLTEMEAARTRLMAANPPAEFMASIQTQPDAASQKPTVRQFPFRIPTLAWGAVAATVLLSISVFVFFGVDNHPARSAGEDALLRWKGTAPVVEVYVQRNDTVQISTDDTILPGDELQYRVVMPEGQKGYVALIAEENGNFETVFPSNDTAEPLRAEKSFELPGAVQIENDTQQLSLHLIYRTESFQIDQLLRQFSEQASTDITKLNNLGIVNTRRTPESD